MTAAAWHASPALLARFRDDPGAVDDMTASSVEAHLVACADCRQVLTAGADPALTATSWEAVADRIDRPRPRLAERLLHGAGVNPGVARLLAATPGLRAAGLASVALLATAAVMLSRTAGAEGPFLVLAPLAPLAAVAAAFTPAAEPAGEAALATPLHGVGLVVRRAAVILGMSFALLALAALALPDLGATAAAWVLPALALALGALALATWTRVEVAVVTLGAGWLLAVTTAWWIADVDTPVADAPTFARAGQVAALVLGGVAVAVLTARRDRFATMEAFR